MVKPYQNDIDYLRAELKRHRCLAIQFSQTQQEEKASSQSVTYKEIIQIRIFDIV